MEIIKTVTDWTVRDLIEGFSENEETGEVTSMNGRLNVRPPYQREYVWDQGKGVNGRVYGGPKQQALIDSILNGYPINVMYFVQVGENDAHEPLYEVLDGQQRIITMAKFADRKFSLSRPSGKLLFDKQNVAENHLENKESFYGFKEFTVYICKPESEEDKLNWFERINTIGEPLTMQEMRSAIANGEGTTRAKKYFVPTSGNGMNAFTFNSDSNPNSRNVGKNYIGDGRKWDRQEVYEQIITWRLDWIRLNPGNPSKIDSLNSDELLNYMLDNRKNVEEAENLWKYFQSVVRWVKNLFPDYHDDMRKVEWGFLYNKYHSNNKLAAESLKRDINILRQDIGDGDNEHLGKKSHIYEYVLAVANGEDKAAAAKKYLQIRDFTEKQKTAQYELQRHVCPHCRKRYEKISWMAGDHIIPYSPLPESGQENGKTIPENLQMLCHSCNTAKRNLPFDKEEELKRLQAIYDMTDDEIMALHEGGKQ